MKAQDGKWSAKMGSMFYGIIGFIILLFIGALAIQIYTGVPVFSGLLTGSLKTAGKLMHQTVAGVENLRNNLKNTVADEKASEAEKHRAKEMLDTLGTMMNNVQDEDVRDYVNKLKTAPAVVRNIFNHNKNEKGNNKR
jgi:flagellar basal body-associated protein FliL